MSGYGEVGIMGNALGPERYVYIRLDNEIKPLTVKQARKMAKRFRDGVKRNPGIDANGALIGLAEELERCALELDPPVSRS